MSANNTNNNKAVFDPKKPGPREKYVTIYGTGSVIAPIAAPPGAPGAAAPVHQRLLVHTKFPLSVLRNHSARAKNEDVPRKHYEAGLMVATSTIDWNVEMPVLQNNIQLSGLQVVLKWILETQPAAGYPASYQGGNMRFPENRTPGVLPARLLILKAILQLEMRDGVSAGLRPAIRTQIENDPELSARDLGFIIQLFQGVDDRLVNTALSTHCTQYAQHSLSSTEMQPYDAVYKAAGQDVMGRWDRQWKHAQSQLRRAREAARAAAAAAPAPQAG